MWVLVANVGFVRVHYNNAVVFMWVLSANLVFAKYHYNQIVDPCWYWVQT